MIGPEFGVIARNTRRQFLITSPIAAPFGMENSLCVT